MPDPLTERRGVNAVEAVFLNDFKWIFREQAVSDFGIDAQAEVGEFTSRPESSWHYRSRPACPISGSTATTSFSTASGVTSITGWAIRCRCFLSCMTRTEA